MKYASPSSRWLASLAIASIVTPALAQRINIDVGTNSTYPVPASTFGAGAAQPGTWNSVPVVNAVPIALVDLTGASNGVTITASGGTAYDSTVNLAGAPINDRNFMADVLDPDFASVTWTIAGLASGNYQIWTYAMAPDDPTYRTNVSVAGSSDPLQTVGGAWSGSYVQGLTHAKHRVTATGAPIVVTTVRAGSPANNFGSINGFQIVKLDAAPASASFCAGDHLDANVTTPCPCGNFGTAGHGCANSLNPSGALLATTGTTNPDTTVLLASGMPSTVSCIFLQGDAVEDVVFGDGVRCAGGTLIRLKTKANAGGTSQYPEVGDPAVSVRGLVTPGTGAVRYYQTYYRNSAGAFCPPETFNVTNGWKIVW